MVAIAINSSQTMRFVFTNDLDRELYRNGPIDSCSCGRYRLYKFRCEINKEVSAGVGTWRTEFKTFRENRDIWFVVDTHEYIKDQDCHILTYHAQLPQFVRELFAKNGSHIDKYCAGMRTWLTDRTLAYAVLYYITMTDCSCGGLRRAYFTMDSKFAVSLQVRRLLSRPTDMFAMEEICEKLKVNK